MIITILRKSLKGSVAENTLKHGCGALNIDATRIATEEESFFKEWERNQSGSQGVATFTGENQIDLNSYRPTGGRWPANVILIGNNSAVSLDVQSGQVKGWSSQNHNTFNPYQGNSFHNSSTQRQGYKEGYNDDGGASRFFKQFEKEEE